MTGRDFLILSVWFVLVLSAFVLLMWTIVQVVV